MPLNEDDKFTMDLTSFSIAFSTFNANNQTDNDDDKSNNSDILSMVIIGGVVVTICSLLSGLIYLYYQNHQLPHSGDSSIETTKNPFRDNNVDVSIDGGSETSEFYGGQPQYGDV